MLNQNKITEVGELYINKGDENKLEIMNERNNRSRILSNRQQIYKRDHFWQ